MPASIENVRRKQAKITAATLPRDLNEATTTMEDVCGLIERGADCVGCDAIKPEPKPWVSTRTIAWAALLVGLCLPPLIPLDEIIGTATAFRGPVTMSHEAILLTPTVHSGEPLVFRIRAEYTRVCAWRWTFKWARMNGTRETIIAATWTPGEAAPIGVKLDIKVPVNTPVGLSPGSYALYSSGAGECNRGDVAQIINPRIPFEIN